MQKAFILMVGVDIPSPAQVAQEQSARKQQSQQPSDDCELSLSDNRIIISCSRVPDMHYLPQKKKKSITNPLL